jgi:hypothetical protein
MPAFLAYLTKTVFAFGRMGLGSAKSFEENYEIICKPKINT